MLKKEKNNIFEWAVGLSDEQLEHEYYKATFDSLGSETEEMYELGYDLRDIEERDKYEKFLCEKSSLLGVLCKRRGIELWEK